MSLSSQTKPKVKRNAAKYDPWRVLGVSNECTDIKSIKSAYKTKRKYLKTLEHDSVNNAELTRLRDAYMYLKETLLYRTEAEQLMRELDTMEVASDLSSSGVKHRYKSAQSEQMFDAQLAGDNSMIQDEDFNVDAILHTMMQDRPTTTSYKALLSGTSQYKDHYNNEPTPGAFGGFDELNGAAPILSDGDYMFVQGSSAAYEPGFTGNLNVDMTNFNEINDRIRGTVSGGKLDKRQLKNYLAMRDEALTAPGPKMTSAEFQKHLGAIEQNRLEDVAAEARQNSHLVRRQLSKLSDQTRGKLFSYDNYRD